MKGFFRELLSDAKISGIIVFFNIMKMTKRGINVTKVEEITNKKMGDEGR
jgi:hypothetical protein